MLPADKVFNFLRDNRGLPVRSMTVFNFLLEMTLCGVALILIVLLVRRFLRGKLGNRAVYFAWLLVAIRLLAPVALPNPLMNELRPTLSIDEDARPVADQIRVRFQDAMSDLSFALSDSSYGRFQGEEYNVSQFALDVAAYTSYGWTGKWFLFAYLAGDALVLCYMIVQNARFRSRLKKRRVSALDGAELEQYRSLCAERGVKRPLPVYYVDPLPSACLVGVLRPYIALPLTLSDSERRMALAHELCHHRARDEWWGVVRNLCCVVHWFNPLVWVAAHCARVDCELACDDRVIATMGEQERVAYANTLVLAAAKRSAPRMSVLATGMTMPGKRLKQRVSAIVRNRRVQRGAVIAFVAVIMCATVFAFGTAEMREESYDIKLDKAKYGFQLDEPFDYPAPEVAPIEVNAPLDTEEKALVYAMKLADSRFIALAYHPGTLQAARLDDEWRVAIPGVEDACELYFDTQGYLLYYDARPYDGYNDYPFKSSDSVRASVDRYIRAFATACLGDFPISAITLDADYYDLNGRYAYGQALGENGDSMFTYLLDLTQMRVVHYQDSARAQFPKGTLFAQAVNNLRSFITETSVFGDMQAADFEAGTVSAERGADGSIHARLTVAAAGLSGSARSTLAERYGASEYYLLEYVTNQHGEFVGSDGRGVNQAEAEAAFAATAVVVSEANPLREETDNVAAPAAQTPAPVEEPTPEPTSISLNEEDGVALRFELFDMTDISPSYGPAPDGAIPLGEAVGIGVRAICDEYKLSRAAMQNYRLSYAYTIDPGMADTPYWWLCFLNNDNSQESYSVSVHSPDGAVINVYGPEDGNG